MYVHTEDTNLKQKINKGIEELETDLMTSCKLMSRLTKDEFKEFIGFFEKFKEEQFNEERTKVPIKIFTDKSNVEDGCLEQAINLANLPFAFKHIALMPDAHLGYGVPIGGILTTKDVVIPNAVGVN